MTHEEFLARTNQDTARKANPSCQPYVDAHARSRVSLLCFARCGGFLASEKRGRENLKGTSKKILCCQAEATQSAIFVPQPTKNPAVAWAGSRHLGPTRRRTWSKRPLSALAGADRGRCLGGVPTPPAQARHHLGR